MMNLMSSMRLSYDTFFVFLFLFLFFILFCVGEASADVKVYFAPKSTVYETDTSAEIRKYLESFKGGDMKTTTLKL
jgi:hypothetical protein